MTTFLKLCVGLAFALALSACGASNTASRAAMPDDTMLGVVQPDYYIDSFTVSVPRSLKVNEKNTYYPRGDIVWRGDMLGDRHAQVKAMFEASIRQAAPRVQGSRPVRVDVQVMRFHAVSEKARYTVGGIHDITFRLRLVDAVTGVQIAPIKVVDADLRALEGQSAIAADARGETQKARITSHLTNVFISEMTQPGGHVNAQLGLMQRINDL
jgi:hypothetical protein